MTDDATREHTRGLDRRRAAGAVRRFRIAFDKTSRPAWESTGDRCSIGSHEANDVVLDDPTVSRFHCEIRIDERGVARLRDLDSRNGTIVDGTHVIECMLRGGAVVRVGRVPLRFELAAEQSQKQLSDATSFGRLTGASRAMRATFALLERAAAADVTVLLQGETGTGKQVAAEAIHESSARRTGPFVTVDCGNLPVNLLEAELFGHEKGAFTGAVDRRVGAFEEASGGTVFLDEIGELPLDTQPKLLRALEERHVRRLGSNRYHRIDVRVIAATNRDLRAEVNSGRFREDLYFRLAVVRIDLPSLRERPEDIPALVATLLDQMKVPAEMQKTIAGDEMLAYLARGQWPGNVRELRNYLQRCIVFEGAPPLEAVEPAAAAAAVDASLRWHEARELAVARFERAYLEDLLRRNGDSVAQAARAAGLDRVYLHKLLRKHRLRSKG